MAIWTAEIKELEKLYESFKGQFPELEKELGQLIHFDDPNVIMLYSRRCLEVIITDLCECELKRDRGTEPLKGIIDKLHKEKKIPPHIIASIHSLNELSTFGTHPKDFDPEQVKPVLINLDIIIKWYLKYKESGTEIKAKPSVKIGHDFKTSEDIEKNNKIPRKRLIAAVTVFVLLIAVVIAILSFPKESKKSIAVLPFINDSPVDSNKYFINGVMEDILTDLQEIKDLRVISRTSVERYRNTNKSISEIARELGVNYIVEGSGQKSGNTLRLNVQLIRAKKENHLWGKTFEQEIRDAKDVFRIQSQIAELIAKELKAAITPKEKLLIEKIPTSSLAAYENYILGENYLGRYTKEDWDIALQYFEKAKEIDPDFALAYAGITGVWIMRAIFSYHNLEEAASIAKSNAAKAFELDSTCSGVYIALGQTQAFINYDFKSAEKSLKKCISFNPNNSYGHWFYGDLLTMLGRSKEALEQSEIALKLDPMNIGFKTDYGLVLYCAGRYNDAITVFQEVLKTDPRNSVALGNLPLVLHKVGKFKEELEIWKLYYSTVFKDFANVFDQGYTNGGLTGALNLQADSLVIQSKTKFIQPCEIAQIYACAGNKERTLDMLDRGYEVHDPNLPFILRYPIYEFVHNEPRFKNLFHKINLPFK